MILDVFLVVRIMVDETRGFCGIPLGAVNKIGLQARHVVHIHLVGTGFGIEFLALLSRDGPHAARTSLSVLKMYMSRFCSDILSAGSSPSLVHPWKPSSSSSATKFWDRSFTLDSHHFRKTSSAEGPLRQTSAPVLKHPWPSLNFSHCPHNQPVNGLFTTRPGWSCCMVGFSPYPSKAKALYMSVGLLSGKASRASESMYKKTSAFGKADMTRAVAGDPTPGAVLFLRGSRNLQH